MKVIVYNKLVRDKIPQIIRRDNAVPIMQMLTHKRFLVELKKKLLEEIKESQMAKTADEVMNEIVDVLEILQTMASIKKITWGRIERERGDKLKKRGGFKKKLFLKSVKQLD